MAQAEQEMSLDDFTMEAPKAVPVFKPEAVAQKIEAEQKAGPESNKAFSQLQEEIKADLDQEVEKIMKDLMTHDMGSTEMKQQVSILNRLGDKEITETSNMSNRMLQTPLRAMRQNDASGGGSVASALKNLRMKVNELDPSNRGKGFSKNKLLGMLPFNLGNRVDSYMQEYKSSESQLNDIVQGLMNGKDSLIQDNATIQVERENMKNLMKHLEQYAYVIKKLDERIEEKLPEIDAVDRLKASDIRQEILFPIRQRSQDIYQHLAVCMQGYMSLQVVEKNNNELIRGVDRATKTTLAALRTAVMVSEALGTQKLVLDQIDAVNDTTNKLIESNANLLQQQGVAIQKQATSAAVDAATLERSFQQIFKAMDEIDSFREKALPNMKKTVESLEASVNNAKNYLSSNRQERIANFNEEVVQEIKDEPAEPRKTVKVTR